MCDTVCVRMDNRESKATQQRSDNEVGRLANWSELTCLNLDMARCERMQSIAIWVFYCFPPIFCDQVCITYTQTAVEFIAVANYWFSFLYCSIIRFTSSGLPIRTQFEYYLFSWNCASDFEYVCVRVRVLVCLKYSHHVFINCNVWRIIGKRLVWLLRTLPLLWRVYA